MCKIKILFNKKNKLFDSIFLFKKLYITLNEQISIKKNFSNKEYIFYFKKPIFFLNKKIISKMLIYHIDNKNKITQLILKTKNINSKLDFFILNNNANLNMDIINNYYININGIIKNNLIVINNNFELISLQKKIFHQNCIKHIKNGVNIINIENTYIDTHVKIDMNTMILPGSIIIGKTYIGNNNIIGPNSFIENCNIGDNCKINNSCLYESSIKNNVNIGPFSHIRPGCYLNNDIKIGNYVELKNTTIKSKTKVSHLTYIGDANIGENVNFGCGCITVNYDGKNKYKTNIANNSFIGCNVNLIAPIDIGSNVYIAAGTTITDNIPDNSFSIGRAKQINKKILKFKT